jgi:hypothetical protein
MWRTRLTFAAAVLLSTLAARTAYAGALGATVRGLDRAAGNDGSKSSGGSSSDDDDDDDDSGWSWGDSDSSSGGGGGG